MPINTTNIDTLSYQLPSFEHLGKYDPRRQMDIVDNFLSAQKERADNLVSLNRGLANGSITKEIYDKQKESIDKNIEQIYHRTPSTEIELGKNGVIAGQHKNKMGFIFIGNTKKAEDNTLFNANFPKITLAVGGGLETVYNPLKNESAKVDPRQNFVPQASAQIHLISNSDIDSDGIAGEAAFKNKAAVQIKSDVLDFSANQAVLIRSLNTPYVSGVRSFAPGGVHIVSGQKSGGGEYKDPEPMVLGKTLSSFLIELITTINELVTIVGNINDGIISLKNVLSLHVHDPVNLISPQVAAYVTATAIDDLKNYGNIKTTLLNFEGKKVNNLMALSKDKFISNFNRVN
jgi:hypothetical protein